jgi:hypothetical protein
MGKAFGKRMKEIRESISFQLDWDLDIGFRCIRELHQGRLSDLMNDLGEKCRLLGIE